MSNTLSLETTSFCASRAVRFCSTELHLEGKCAPMWVSFYVYIDRGQMITKASLSTHVQ